MDVELESTSDRCYYRELRSVGERFTARESEAVVLVGLNRAKRVFATEPAPSNEGTLADLADKKPRRKGTARAASDKPRRTYKRRDMRAEG